MNRTSLQILRVTSRSRPSIRPQLSGNIARRYIGSEGGPAAANAAESAVGSTRKLLGTVMFCGLAVAGVGLGMWQVERYQWKVDLIESTKAHSKEPPIELSTLSSEDLTERIGCKVTVQGTFEHDKEILLGPRSPPVGVMGPSAQGMASNPQGFFVITPFRTTDGRVIFVNRGWVPRQSTSWSRPSGLTRFTAVLAMMESGGTFSPVNDVKSKKLLWLQSSAVQEATGYADVSALLNVVVDDMMTSSSAPAAQASAPTSFPAAQLLSQSHLQQVEPPTHAVYAVTWFSLAITALGFAVFLNKKTKGGSAAAASVARRSKGGKI